jgi:transcriptional regulator with XRE-family HTH domain
VLTARAGTCYQYGMTTGLDLKLERTAQRVTGRAVARAMGVSSSRIGHVEASAVVTPDFAARYRAAVATCVQERTSEERVA